MDLSVGPGGIWLHDVVLTSRLLPRRRVPAVGAIADSASAVAVSSATIAGALTAERRVLIHRSFEGVAAGPREADSSRGQAHFRR